MISNAAAEGGPRRVRRGSVGALFKLLAASVLLFAVFYDDFDVGVAREESCGELFGAVDGAVLAAGAAEADGEVREVAFEVFVDALRDYGEGVVEEDGYGLFVAQEFYDGGVLACVCFVFGVAAGIGERAAVEDMSAAVAGGVFRQALFVGEAHHRDGELRVEG